MRGGLQTIRPAVAVKATGASASRWRTCQASTDQLGLSQGDESRLEGVDGRCHEGDCQNERCKHPAPAEVCANRKPWGVRFFRARSSLLINCRDHLGATAYLHPKALILGLRCVPQSTGQAPQSTGQAPPSTGHEPPSTKHVLTEHELLKSDLGHGEQREGGRALGLGCDSCHA